MKFSEALEALEGDVLEIGSSGMYEFYSAAVCVDVFEPKKRKRMHIREDDFDASISALDTIPMKKYAGIVAPFVYEILSEKRAQELSAIIGARMKIGATLVVLEHEQAGFFQKLLGRWTGTTIEDTTHGLKKLDEDSDDGVRVRVYERVVLK